MNTDRTTTNASTLTLNVVGDLVNGSIGERIVDKTKKVIQKGGGVTFGAYKEKWPQRDELCAKVMPIPGGGFAESRIGCKIFL